MTVIEENSVTEGIGESLSKEPVSNTVNYFVTDSVTTGNSFEGVQVHSLLTRALVMIDLGRTDDAQMLLEIYDRAIEAGLWNV